MRLLVTGATGYVGSRLVCTLIGRGHDVVVTSRRPRSLQRFDWHDNVTTVAMDVHDPASVAAGFAAATGPDDGPIDAVYYLVHGIGERDFADTERDAARTLAEGARDAGVRRVVYLGGFVPDDELSPHLRSRAEVGESLQLDDGPDLVWLRAAVILGAGSTSFEIIRYAADRFPVLLLPEWMHNRMDPISIRDVLYYLAAVADPDVPAGVYDIAGPDRSRYSDVVQAYLSATRQFRPHLPLPTVSTRLAGLVSGQALPAPASLTAELVRSLESPMNLSENRIREIVADPPGGLIAISEAMRASVSSPDPQPVCRLGDVHHLADTDPEWAGGDWLRVRRGIREAVGNLTGLATAPARFLLSAAARI